MRKRSNRVRFRTGLSALAVATVTAGVCLVATPVAGGRASPAANPPANITPSPTLFRAQTLHGYLEAINAARADEGVGPIELPSNWRVLTVPQQLFVTVDMERVARGLPPVHRHLAVAPGDSAGGGGQGRRTPGTTPCPPSPKRRTGRRVWAPR